MRRPCMRCTSSNQCVWMCAQFDGRCNAHMPCAACVGKHSFMLKHDPFSLGLICLCALSLISGAVLCCAVLCCTVLCTDR